MEWGRPHDLPRRLPVPLRRNGAREGREDGPAPSSGARGLAGGATSVPPARTESRRGTHGKSTNRSSGPSPRRGTLLIKLHPDRDTGQWRTPSGTRDRVDHSTLRPCCRKTPRCPNPHSLNTETHDFRSPTFPDLQLHTGSLRLRSVPVSETSHPETTGPLTSASDQVPGLGPICRYLWE